MLSEIDSKNALLRMNSSSLQLVSSIANIFWILALGGLGSCAFLGTTLISENARLNTTSVLTTQSPSGGQISSEFDLTDRNLILTRIVIGILFAFLLGLSLSSGSLKFIVGQVVEGNAFSQSASANTLKSAQEYAAILGLTLLPFVVGFSTTLILGIMDRFVSSIRTIFGFTSK